MSRQYSTLSPQDFSATLAEIKRHAERDRIERELRARQAFDEYFLSGVERERQPQREPEYAI